MTLHWWMHWFWITQLLSVLALLFVVGHCVPVHTEDTPEAQVSEEPWPLPSSVRLEDRESSEHILKRGVGKLSVTTSLESNSSVRTSKSLRTHPVESVTDRVKLKKIDVEDQTRLELNDTLNINTESDMKVTVLAFTVDPLSNSSVEKFGQAASRSLEDEDTTQVSSVAPISKSRVAGPLPSGHHSGLDAAAITGIALGIVVFGGFAGAVSFVVYRRRYVNKPQTLNDKCSNPDSSGYIDDSTLRENSEEMYSLDNDSFLNSLEAMTIQNYWTDNQETCWRHSRPC